RQRGCACMQRSRLKLKSTRCDQQACRRRRSNSAHFFAPKRWLNSPRAGRQTDIIYATLFLPEKRRGRSNLEPSQTIINPDDESVSLRAAQSGNQYAAQQVLDKLSAAG